QRVERASRGIGGGRSLGDLPRDHPPSQKIARAKLAPGGAKLNRGGSMTTAKKINPQARCRNCRRSATDRKRRYCSPACRLRPRVVRGRGDRGSALLDGVGLPGAARERTEGTSVRTRWPRIGDGPPALDEFLRRDARAMLIGDLGRRP